MDGAGLFSFPHPVDEVSARLVVTGVVVQFAGILATGPTLSPLGTLVTRVVRPRLSWAVREVPGPPKRFAHGIGERCRRVR